MSFSRGHSSNHECPQGLCGQGLRRKVVLQTDGGGCLFVRPQVLSCGLPEVEFGVPCCVAAKNFKISRGRGLACMISASSSGRDVGHTC